MEDKEVLDGKYILFASDVGKDSLNVANYDLWIISNGGGMATQLTTNGSEDDCPVVSPDQKYIYFISNRGFKYGIWRIPFPTMASSGQQKGTRLGYTRLYMLRDSSFYHGGMDIRREI